MYIVHLLTLSSLYMNAITIHNTRPFLYPLIIIKEPTQVIIRLNNIPVSSDVLLFRSFPSLPPLVRILPPTQGPICQRGNKFFSGFITPKYTLETKQKNFFFSGDVSTFCENTRVPEVPVKH